MDSATLIVMDAPPPMEDCRPFVHVAKLLAGAGVHAPEVLAGESTRGFLLLTDLGDQTYLSGLDASSAPGLYADASDALIRWQQATRDGVLPTYDEALLARELALFPEWYVRKHRGITLTPAQEQTLARAFRLILDNNLAQPRVFVHRDYHSRNLMRSRPNPGILDFQDAVIGPITYDLVSLLRDAYVAWDEEHQIDWAVRYWEHARATGLSVGVDFGAFWRDFEWMGVQRQLKVLGIFARLVSPRREGGISRRHASGNALSPRCLRALRRARPVGCAPRRNRERRVRRDSRPMTPSGATSIGAMILAAGRGERMRPLSDVTPKPLLEAGGRPLIAWQIEALARAGFHDIVVNASHLAGRLVAALGDGSAFGVTLRWSIEPEPLDVAGGIATALPLLPPGPALIVAGDIVTAFDYASLRRRADAMACHAIPARVHLVMVENPPYHPGGDFALSGGQITRDEGPRLTYASIGLFDTGLFRELPRGTKLKLLPYLQRWIAEGLVSGETFAGQWANVGTPDDLGVLDAALRHRIPVGSSPRSPADTPVDLNTLHAMSTREPEE